MSDVNGSIGRYRLVGPLGRGGMGEVYRATDTALGRDVALKILPAAVTNDPDRLQRFEREARAASALNHPHLIAIYDIGRHADAAGGAPVHYIAMELVDGQTLRDALTEGRLGLARTLEYLSQAADALAAAHSAGVIHRDLKPENLMIAGSGYVKVLDFGLAKLRDTESATVAREAETRAALTTPGMLLGTAGYMSPEQAQGRESDHRADIFAFGCILYEAVAGKRAFEGPSFVETLAKVIRDQPAPLPATVPAIVRAIVDRCLVKNPADRYGSMRDIAADLKRAQRELEANLAQAPRRSRAVVLAAVVALACIIGVAAWMATRTGTTATPELQVQQLTASGNVIDTAISPDGRYLAFVESTAGAQSLWIRQIGGSRDIEIVPAPGGGFWGIAFAPDGRSIYYALRDTEHPTGRLFAIEVLGGTPRPVLDGILSAVTFSPDGKRIAFLRGGFPQRDATALMVADVDGANQRVLGTRTAPHTFQSFFAAPSWSPDGARIAATAQDTQKTESRLVLFDAATGTEEVMPAIFSDGGCTAWLPDGSGILFVARERDSLAGVFQKHIWLQPYPRGEVRRLTHDDADYRNVRVTADGKQFAGVLERSSGGLWRVPLNGEAPQRIRSERHDGRYGVAVLPDGRMAINATSRAREQRIEMLSADGTNRQVLAATGTNIWPAVSPDGRTIVFVSNRENQPGLWRINADGTGTRLLAAMPVVTYPSVTQDGRWVVVEAPLEGAPAAWRVPIDGGEPTLIARQLARPTPSPDGTLVAGFYRTAPGAPMVLAVLPFDGQGQPRTLQQVWPASGFGIIEWAKDGKSIVYSSSERTNLFRQPLSGGASTQLTALTDLILTFGDNGPDGESVIASRGILQRDAYLFSNFR